METRAATAHLSSATIEVHGFEPLLADALRRLYSPEPEAEPGPSITVHLVRMSLASVAEPVRVQSPWIAVIDTESSALRQVARRHGAAAVVARGTGLAGLDEAIDAVATGDADVEPLLRGGDRPDSLGGLSARQVSVLALITQGASNEQIAEELSISPNTARTHVQNVLAKLGVSNRLAAAAVGRAAGLGVQTQR